MYDVAFRNQTEDQIRTLAAEACMSFNSVHMEGFDELSQTQIHDPVFRVRDHDLPHAGVARTVAGVEGGLRAAIGIGQAIEQVELQFHRHHRGQAQGVVAL